MDTDIVIIGAGAAGLAASLWLAEHSVRVIVLEGRDRIGGRVLSQTVGSVVVPAELGAEFIHGEAPETSAFLSEAGLLKTATGDVSWACGPGGVLHPEEDDFVSNEIFERARSLAHDESVETFLRRFDHDALLREPARRARAFVEGFEAADPALASVRAIADELRSGVDSTTSRPIGSYAPLFHHLAKRCARADVDIRLGTTVRHVAWKTGEVLVEARDTNGLLPTLRARCALITVPVGVLQQRPHATPLTFAPPLPDDKRAALAGLEMGHAVRVALAFRTPFWESLEDGRYRDAAFFRCESGSFNAFWTQAPQRSRSIVAWAGGPRATALDPVSEQGRIDRARDEFGDLFGLRDLARRECEGGATHDWSTDPFACGAYSYVATGGGGARGELGTPVDDTLFFAGEATSTDGQGGTVSGAFESGVRAAAEAVRARALAGASSNGESYRARR